MTGAITLAGVIGQVLEAGRPDPARGPQTRESELSPDKHHWLVHPRLRCSVTAQPMECPHESVQLEQIWPG